MLRVVSMYCIRCRLLLSLPYKGGTVPLSAKVGKNNLRTKMVIFLCCEYAAESEPRGVGQIWEFQKFVN